MKKYSILLFALAVLAALVFGSCSSTSHIEKADDVSFSRFRTFGWAPVDSNRENSKNEIIDANIRRAITDELEKKGLRKNDRNPDILLDYTVSVEKNTRRESSPVYSNPTIQPYYNPATRRISNYYVPSQLMGYNDYNVPIRSGMLTINMYDARNHKLIWQGWTQNELNNGNITSSDVKQDVRSILKKLDIGS
jgi:Domain of unknown function (DUF4136)